MKVDGIDVVRSQHWRYPLERHSGASLLGSSTPTTIKKVSSSATPLSSALTNDPYKSLKTALQADIDKDVWATLCSDTSGPLGRSAAAEL